MDAYEEKIGIIERSKSYADREMRGILPEPNEDNGYYFVYYPEGLYKSALIDILTFSADNMRIWYDRKLESGAAWEEQMLDKIGEYNCIGAVLYLNRESLSSPFFYRICAEIEKCHKNYCSVNYEFDGENAVSGRAMLGLLPSGAVPPEAAALYKKMFSNAITFIRGDAPAAEKMRAIRLLQREDILSYIVADGEAEVVSVKDLFADTVTVPEEIERGGKRYPVTKVAALAFANCRQLKKIYFPETLREIGYAAERESGTEKGIMSAPAFSRSIATAAVPSLAAGYTFYGCRSLKEVVLPQSLEKIGYATFKDSPNLRRVDLGGVIRCHPAAFCTELFAEDDYKLERITFSPHICKVGDRYCGSDDFVKIEIPRSVRQTDGYTDFPMAERMAFPEGTKMLNGILQGNADVREVVLPASYKYVTQKEFAGCSALERAVFSGEDLDLSDTNGCRMFSGCRRLREVVLPKALTVLDFTSFLGCPELKELDVPASVGITLSFPYKSRKKRERIAEKYGTDAADADIVYISRLTLHSDTALAGGKIYGRQYRGPKIGAFFLHPVASFREWCGNRLMRRMFLFWRNLPRLQTVYLPDTCGKRKIRGFRETASDRKGYIRFERKGRVTD